MIPSIEKPGFSPRFRPTLTQRGFLWLRMGLFLMLPVGAFVLGYIAGEMDPLYAIILSVIPVFVILIEWFLNSNQAWGPVIILGSGLFVNYSLPTGTASRIVLSLVFACLFFGIWILKMIVVEKRFQLASSPANKPLLAFMTTSVIALGWSNLFRDPLVIIWDSFPFVQVAATIVMIMLPTSFLLVANHIKNIKHLKIMVGLFLLGGFLGIINLYTNIDIPVNTAGLFSMWILAFTYSFAMFHNALPKWVRVILLVLAIFWIRWGLMHFTWLTGWLPGLMVLGLLTLLHSRRMIIVFILLILVFGLLNLDMLRNAVEAEYNESGETRLSALATSTELTREHILFGTGPAGYAAYYMTYTPYNAMATHNNYIDIFAQTGIIGMVFFIWFFGALVWQVFQVFQRVRGRRDFIESTVNALFAGTLGCVFMMGFGDWMIPFAYTQSISGFDYIVYSWLFMGMIVVLDNKTKALASGSEVD